MSYTNRNEIPEKYKWDLSDIYATEEAWEQAFADMAQKVEINLPSIVLQTYLRKGQRHFL